jgi:hypothetical protein
MLIITLFIDLLSCRCFVTSCTTYNLACRNHAANSKYVLFSNKISAVLDLLLHRLTVSVTFTCLSVFVLLYNIYRIYGFQWSTHFSVIAIQLSDISVWLLHIQIHCCKANPIAHTTLHRIL